MVTTTRNLIPEIRRVEITFLPPEGGNRRDGIFRIDVAGNHWQYTLDQIRHMIADNIELILPNGRRFDLPIDMLTDLETDYRRSGRDRLTLAVPGTYAAANTHRIRTEEEFTPIFTIPDPILRQQRNAEYDGLLRTGIAFPETNFGLNDLLDLRNPAPPPFHRQARGRIVQGPSRQQLKFSVWRRTEEEILQWKPKKFASTEFIPGNLEGQVKVHGFTIAWIQNQPGKRILRIVLPKEATKEQLKLIRYRFRQMGLRVRAFGRHEIIKYKEVGPEEYKSQRLEYGVVFSLDDSRLQVFIDHKYIPLPPKNPVQLDIVFPFRYNKDLVNEFNKTYLGTWLNGSSPYAMTSTTSSINPQIIGTNAVANYRFIADHMYIPATNPLNIAAMVQVDLDTE